MIVRVSTGNLYRFVPDEGMGAQFWVPVKLHEGGLTRAIHKAESMHAEALHHAIAARNGAVGHLPHQHVGGFRHQRDEIPEGVMCRGGLRHGMMLLWF